MGRWWYGSRNLTKEGIETETAARYFKAIKENTSEDDVLDIVASSHEFEVVRSTMFRILLTMVVLQHESSSRYHRHSQTGEEISSSKWAYRKTFLSTSSQLNRQTVRSRRHFSYAFIFSSSSCRSRFHNRSGETSNCR